MKNRGLVSVVIPMYNSEATITSVLDSVKNQTANYYIKEVIVINDGSTDGSKEKVINYQIQNSEVPIILVNQENGGVSRARNTGLKKASGKYIALLDSDDIWLPNKIKRQVEILEKNPYIFFLGGASDKDNLTLYFWKKIRGLYKVKPRDVCWKSFPVTPSVIFRRGCLEKVGYFNEGQGYGEDLQFFQRFFKEYNFFYLAEPVVSIGINKNFYGQEGLTSNIKEMHKGRQMDLKELYQENMISRKFYLFMKIFNEIKFVRRKVLTKYNSIIKGGKKC